MVVVERKVVTVRKQRLGNAEADHSPGSNYRTGHRTGLHVTAKLP
jgi:hypothetical protein